MIKCLKDDYCEKIPEFCSYIIPRTVNSFANVNLTIERIFTPFDHMKTGHSPLTSGMILSIILVSLMEARYASMLSSKSLRCL